MGDIIRRELLGFDDRHNQGCYNVLPIIKKF